MSALDSAILGAYLLCLGVLVLFAAHRCWLLHLLARDAREAEGPPSAPARREPAPLVTVQLPLYNERRVAGRLLRAVGRLDYPPERLEVQILDDSTDATSRIAAAGARALSARGIRAVHLHREDRTGYKAGALQAGLEQARGELVAIFDADFVPPRDFLRRTVRAFEDSAVGMVQARWDHLDATENLLTRVQAVMLDGHFAVEHAARARTGRPFNFNGTAGIWRKACLGDAGGWRAATLTEDLDISYRAQLRGWRFRYLDDLRVPAELPCRAADFKGQQERWARGSIQTLRLLGSSVLRSRRLTPAAKVEALFHLTANFCYPALLALALLLFPALVVRHERDLAAPLLWLDLLFLGAGLGCLAAFYARASGRTGLLRLPALVAVGAGLSVSNTVAVVRGLLEKGGVFRRTPKRGRSGRVPYRGRMRPTSLAEIALGAYLAAAAATAASLGMWGGVPFLALFSWGFLQLGLSSAWPGSGGRARLEKTLSQTPRRRARAGAGGFLGLPPWRAPWASPGGRAARSSADR